MKNLVAINGTPATAGQVTKEIAFQLGKIAVVWIGSNVIHRVVFNAYFNHATRLPKIDLPQK